MGLTIDSFTRRTALPRCSLVVRYTSTSALCRYGGLRCPSELLTLRREDIDWVRGRMLVTSPKTARHPGGESRTVPLFPELRPHLEAVLEQSDPRTEFVITRYRDARQNLRTQFQRIIRRAQVKPWPKLFQNLRSTRENELAAVHPLHVVCAWMGNSRPVAIKHYLQVTDADFDRAIGESPVGSEKGEQNREQHPGAVGYNDVHDTPKSSEICISPTIKKQGIRLRGIEPPTYGLGNRCSIP